MKVSFDQPNDEIVIELTQKEQLMLMDRLPDSPPSHYQFAERLMAVIRQFRYDYGHIPIKAVIID